jgi:hypothetical protein
MPNTRGTRRALLSWSRSLPSFIPLWGSPPTFDTPTLDALLGLELMVGSPVLDVPEVGIA